MKLLAGFLNWRSTHCSAGATQQVASFAALRLCFQLLCSGPCLLPRRLRGYVQSLLRGMCEPCARQKLHETHRLQGVTPAAAVVDVLAGSASGHDGGSGEGF